MKILHVALSAPYNNYWGYQDNLLPKYHRKLGHDVTIITTNLMHNDNGTIITTDPGEYELEDGVHVIRLSKKKIICKKISSILQWYNIRSLVDLLHPDFIFFHGLINSSIIQIVRYKKEHPECTLVQDNHLDFNIGNKFDSIKKKLLRFYYRSLNRYSQKYASKVYGVTPWRKRFAEEYFKINPSITDVLIMGADDEKLDFEHRSEIRSSIRREYNVNNNDFLIVTGGKIDKKKNIHTLMRACIGVENVKLLIFGNVLDDIKDEFFKLLNEGENIIYVGWINADKVYDYFFAADLVLFPGQHSVLWEQACASKVPCVFEKWEGMEHVNNGGNSDFIIPITPESIKEKIKELHFTDLYYQMKRVAESEKTNIYLYSTIAAKSLECTANNDEYIS